ncbi:MAG: hypothetical protein OEY28_05680 [Nitrospira sp.]|nr:hypothetical protein [Nitrospira sp.]
MGVILGLILASSGCFWSKRSEKSTAGRVEPIALTPSLWLSPSVTTASLSYANACGQADTLLIADLLAESLSKKLGQGFSGVIPQQGLEQTDASDGFIEVGLGFKQIELAVPQQVKGTYPVTVTLGTELAFLAEDGTSLFSTKVQGKGRGDVEVGEQSCAVTGLEPIVQQAIEAVGENLLRQVTESSQLRTYVPRKAMTPPAGAVTANQQTELSAPGTIREGAAASGMMSAAGPSAFTGAPTQSTVLVFHAIVRDENQDHMLQQGEALTVEVEVKNSGQAEAKEVEVVFGGEGALAGYFPPTVAIGNMQPGEVKRTSMTNRIAGLEGTPRAELLLSVRSQTTLAPVPSPKQFELLVKPEKWITDAEASDIDLPPKPLVTPKQTKAVVVAIGVGAFRNERMMQVKYAGRDAEVMAGYLRAIGGVPDERVRVLVDHYALKEDIAETFDEWLPKHVDAATVVYVYFSGRAVVDGVSGAVSLVPFDGATTATKRLYPVRRLQETLSRLPIQRAIMMFEVSLDPTPGASPAATPHADWGIGADDEQDQVMWMVGNRSLQEAHAYEPGKHGLFTYHLLRGMQGLADIDRDGTVVAGELCTYARREVIDVARGQFGNAQHPLCSPPPGQGAVVRIHPMAKGNNPKPSVPEKAPESVAESPGPSGQSMNVGPEK